MFFSYLFRSSSKSLQKLPEPRKITVYLVLNKNSETPIGIYSTLEKAIENGERSTYHNCKILEYIIDEKCKYLADIVYENK